MFQMLKRWILGEPLVDEATKAQVNDALDENRRVTLRANTQIFDNIEQSQSTVEVVDTLLRRMESRKNATPH